MSPPIPEPVILQGPKDSSLNAAVVGCGGTGCNILAEGELAKVMTTIAIGSEPRTMASLKVDKSFIADPRKLESCASVSAKSLKLAGNELEKELSSYLEDVDITFILAGLGGLSGGWGAVLASRASVVSKGFGFCVASVPFSVEGGSRKDRATAQLKTLV
ncbi:MAG: hypothetical protein Q7J68_04545, partial [Thermoplasmata archaeon]|nr:hypothetical protein [Thermoplasmata archaeon]